MLFALLLCCASVGAQAATRAFETVGTIEQVPDGVITSLAVDGQGLLWVATTDGLVRFDGYRFRLYRASPDDPSGLPGSRIQKLLTGSDGRLWVGTYSDGVAVYDPVADRFSAFAGVPGSPDGLPSGTVRALAQTPDGTVWVGTTGEGLGRIGPKGEVSRFAGIDASGGAMDGRISALAVDLQGALWIGSWQGLGRLRPGSQTVERVLSEPGDSSGFASTTIRGIYVSSDGDVWVGAQQGQMARIPAALVAADAPIRPEQVKRWRGEGMNAALEPGDGSLWVAHARGIDVYDLADTRRRETLRARPVDPLALANAEIRDLVMDASGWVWTGSFGGGLQRVDPNPRGLQSRRFDAEGDAPLSQLSAQALAPDRLGGLWVGVAQNGLARFDASLQLREVLREGDPGVGALAGQQPFAVAESDDGRLWLATERGLFQRAPGARAFELASGPDFLERAAIRRLWTRADGTLWIATGDGLFRRELDGRLKRLAQVDGGRVGGSINALEFDAEGAWVGGSAGLFRFDPERDGLIPRAMRVGEAPLVADVLGLLRDRGGQLWLDVGGLHRLQSELGDAVQLEAISARHGYPGVAFGANLLDDAQGRVWTHRFMYDPGSDTLHRLGRADGAMVGTGWFRSYARLSDGRLVFGASEGLLSVRPEDFRASRFLPTLVPTELRIDGELRPFGPLADRIELQPNERGFSLEFAALDLGAPELLGYRYRLLDVAPDWVRVDASARQASFGGLWPGEYRLELQASGRDGRFEAAPRIIDVTVLPAWWQTLPAILVGVVGFGVLVHVTVRWREGRLRRAGERLEAEIEARTRDLQALSAELRRRNQEYEQASLTDPLTGLSNRRFAMQELPKEVALCLRRRESAHSHAGLLAQDLVLFIIDIDHFKQINDRHGHAAGDAVLVEFAQRLRAVFRASDHLVRWGGEEFLAVARETGRAHAAELAERVRLSVSQRPFVLPAGDEIRCTASIGFAPFPLLAARPDGAGWEEVVDLADHLLYAAKHGGRNAWLGVFPIDATHMPARARGWGDVNSLRRGAAEVVSSLDQEQVLRAISTLQAQFEEA